MTSPKFEFVKFGKNNKNGHFINVIVLLIDRQVSCSLSDYDLWALGCSAIDGGPFTVLPCINTELVDARGGLRQNIDSVAGGIHVVEEVDGQGREGEHQHPHHRQQVCHHYKLEREGAEQTLGLILIMN